MSDGIKYVLFIDDANQVTNLKYILEYVTEKKEVKEIKLIMTIRDYAKSKVKQVTNDYFIEKEIKIKPLSNDEIKKILTENLGINNNDYLKTVAKIANGNPRLAVLAGEISKKKGYISLRNSTEIFSHYYGNIINNLDISTKQIEVLFIVALFVTIKINNTLLSKKLFDYFGINIAEFTKTCNELNGLELVDVYADEVVKISDQSFSNYILKYVLFDKKMIMFSTLLNLLFPEIKAKLIYVINTMGELFFTDELEQYLTEEINKSWDKANSSIQNEYLETFYYFNLEKTLKIIYENIENENQNEFDLKCFDFNKSKNNQTIFNKNISILSGLKYTDYRRDAVEMIMIYFKKRPDLFMEFYTALTLKMGLDKHSSYYNFLFELEILDIIWKHTDNGNNYNESLLFIYVANKILDCCVNTTEQGDNKFNVNLITLRFRPNEEIKKLRKYIYEKLSILYFDKEYECIINNLLEGFHENGLDENDAKDFFEFDLQMIVDNFYKKIDVLSFRQAYILYKLDNHRKKLKIKDVNLSSIYNLNKELNIYKLLSKEYYKGNSYVENIEKRKTKIHEEIKKYTDNEYEFLFSACKVIQDAIGTTWELSKGLEYVFLLNEASVETYINILEKYFKYGSPLNCSCNKIISYLLNHISPEKICEILDKHHFSNKELWYKSIWECIPREGINNEVIELFKNRINNECEKDIPCLPHVVYFEKFIDNDKEILYHVTNVLINKNLPSYIIRDFLGNFIDEAEANTIINIYENNIHLLEKMYLIAATDNFDYEGRLLFLIVEKDKIFWEKYIDYISKEKYHREYEDSIFETIWSLDNYDSLVSIAFKKLVEEDHFYSIGNLEAKQIFVNRKNNSLIIDRKKKWIKQYIVNNTQDISKIKRIFSAVDVAFPDIKKELLVFFINKNNDFNCFEKIPLFPNGRSWTGSEIPSIDREINFLVSLKNELNGVNFIKHRNYLKEEIQRLENYKKRVAINEYIENEDLI